MTLIDLPFSSIYDVSRLGNRTEHVTLRPDADAQARMIAAYDLLGLDEIVCEMELRPYRKAGVQIGGRLKAVARQPCGVTLDPVTQFIDERFERRFDAAVPEHARDIEVEIDAFADDPPDPFDGREIDLGAVMCEQFALALDPFPRAQGAELPAESDGTRERGDAAKPVRGDRPSPFAVLSGLRSNGDGRGSE